MRGAIQVLHDDLAAIRTGRANPESCGKTVYRILRDSHAFHAIGFDQRPGTAYDDDQTV